MLRAYGATGLRLPRAFASLIPTPAYTHIFAIRERFAFPYRSRKNVMIPPERYVPFFLKNFGNILTKYFTMCI
jgi:hypothetical protein